MSEDQGVRSLFRPGRGRAAQYPLIATHPEFTPLAFSAVRAISVCHIGGYRLENKEMPGFLHTGATVRRPEFDEDLTRTTPPAS